MHRRMRTHARRMALAALSALAATAVFTAPAGATVFNQGISVDEHAVISPDGGVTLSGPYHCEQASPEGAMQIKVTVVQDGNRLSIGTGGDLVCDGHEHEWRAHSPLSGGVHPGRATATAELQEIRLSGGLFPRSISTLAKDSKDIRIHGIH